MNSSIHVFDEAITEKIAEISGLPSEKFAQLQTRLEAIGKHFRTVILTVPTDLSLGPEDSSSSVRQQWLRTRLQRPIDQLLASIEETHMLASWPEAIASALSDEDWSKLRSLLGQLRQFSEELSQNLQSRTSDSSTMNAELRFDLVSKLADACREAGLPLSRHRYDECGYTLPGARVVQLASQTICGEPISIDQHLRDYLKLHQE